MNPELYKASVNLRDEIRKKKVITDAEAEWVYQFSLSPKVQRIIQAAIEKEAAGDD